jgi:predicted lipoprotein with Yx(FWY)xxD motif
MAAIALCLATATLGACAKKTATTSASPSSSGRRSGNAVVAVATSSVGRILVDGSGRTLYLFLADKGTSSTCYSSCASTWPPLLTQGTPQAGNGTVAGDLGTTKRTDGKTEVTYAHHPLYYYVADTKPGMTSGQGLNQFGAVWYVVSPAGGAITTKPSASPSPTSSTSSGSSSSSGY